MLVNISDGSRSGTCPPSRVMTMMRKAMTRLFRQCCRILASITSSTSALTGHSVGRRGVLPDYSAHGLVVERNNPVRRGRFSSRQVEFRVGWLRGGFLQTGECCAGDLCFQVEGSARASADLKRIATVCHCGIGRIHGCAGLCVSYSRISGCSALARIFASIEPVSLGLAGNGRGRLPVERPCRPCVNRGTGHSGGKTGADRAGTDHANRYRRDAPVRQWLREPIVVPSCRGIRVSSLAAKPAVLPTTLPQSAIRLFLQLTWNVQTRLIVRGEGADRSGEL